MTLKLKLFGITKEIIGHTEMDYPIDETASVSTLKKGLKAQFPKLQDLASLAIAVNGEYVRGDVSLSEQDEVVLIPPVSGG